MIETVQKPKYILTRFHLHHQQLSDSLSRVLCIHTNLSLFFHIHILTYKYINIGINQTIVLYRRSVSFRTARK